MPERTSVVNFVARTRTVISEPPMFYFGCFLLDVFFWMFSFGCFDFTKWVDTISTTALLGGGNYDE